MIRPHQVEEVIVRPADLDAHIERIVGHTRNTWNRTRSQADKGNDSLVGKIGEVALARRLEEQFAHRSYDSTRLDNFENPSSVDAFLAPLTMKDRLWSDQFATVVYQHHDGVNFQENFLQRLVIRRGVFSYELKSTRADDYLYDGRLDVKKVVRWHHFFQYPTGVRDGKLTQELEALLKSEEYRLRTLALTPPFVFRAYVQQLVGAWRVYLIGFMPTEELLWSENLEVRCMGKGEQRGIFYKAPMSEGLPLEELTAYINRSIH